MNDDFKELSSNHIKIRKSIDTTSKTNLDEFIIVKFVNLKNVLAEVGGFSKSITYLFVFLFGGFIYN